MSMDIKKKMTVALLDKALSVLPKEDWESASPNERKALREIKELVDKAKEPGSKFNFKQLKRLADTLAKLKKLREG